MDNQCISKQEEIYNALWATFEPFCRKMTPEQMAEFDSLVDIASRKLASATADLEECGLGEKCPYIVVR